MLKPHYLTEVKWVLHELPVSVIYFLLVNFPLFSLFCVCCVFFFSSSTFFHVQYISVYKKTSIRVACVLNNSGLKRVTIKHSRVGYPNSNFTQWHVPFGVQAITTLL